MASLRTIRTFPYAGLRRGLADYRGQRRGMALDVLGDLDSAENAVGATFLNAIPTWAGGQVLTPGQLQTIQAQNVQAINQAATDPTTGQVNTDLANAEIQQMLSQTAASAAQSQAQAVAQDTPTSLQNLLGTGNGSGSPSGSSILETLLIIAAVGVGGYVVIQLVK